MKKEIVCSVLAATQAPLLEVRDHTGELLCSVGRAGAAALMERGWADPIGKNCVKYLKLRANAPWKPLPRNWWHGSETTQAVRGDESCKRYGPGQLMGNSKLLREHRKI
jgi:hypothetical protein